MIVRLFRLLASPSLALTLLGLLVVAALAGGTLPQSARLSPQELDAWHQAWPLLSLWLERLGLADVYASTGFFALYVALIVNLTAGTVAHVAYLLAWFRGEASARTLSLSALPPALVSLPEAGPNGRRRGGWGLAGLPLLHAGVVVIVVAALVNSSDRLGAHFELAEGEVLSQAKGKLLLERGSRLPGDELGFRLRLDALRVEMESGRFRELQARVSLQQADGPLRQETLAVNHPLRVGSYQIYLDKNVGQTALFERTLPDGQRRSLLINFMVARESWGKDTPLVRDEVMMFEERPVNFRMALTPGAAPRFRLIAERRGKPVFEGVLAPGEVADLGVYQLKFIGTAPWAGLYLASGQALKWVFAGFVLALAGFALHLLVHPRRLRLRRDGDGWLLEGWAMRDDWRFDRQWREWERGR
ncbi:MAG: cytochrome c biogenesis protein ResB [Sulfurimicrobium sp.]|nr:cytochrome c biogenesis protein ResB [Sulfurimicrobium sp.]